MIPYKFEISSKQIDGTRDYQEDAIFTNVFSDYDGNPAALLIVADGMGGHAAGNVASNLVIQTISQTISTDYGSHSVPDLLRKGIEKANASLAGTIKETEGLKGMGSTVVAVLLEQKGMWWASVGDSLLYVYRKGRIVRKNEDHSYGGYVNRMKSLDPTFEKDPVIGNNALMSVLSGEEINRIDISENPMRIFPHDRILIASDGLETLDVEALASCCERNNRSVDVIDCMIRGIQTINLDKQDNTSIIVANVVREKVEQQSSTRHNVAVPVQPSKLAEKDAKHRMKSGQAKEKSSAPVIVLGLILGLVVAVTGAFFAGWIPVDNAIVQQVKKLMAGESENLPKSGGVSPVEPILDEEEPLENTASVQQDVVPATTPSVDPDTVLAPLPLEQFSDKIRGGGRGPKLVKLPGGSFMMGSASNYPEPSERPEHIVTLPAFAISVTEITITEYNRFARATSRRTLSGNAKDPARWVSWNSAAAYALWLSRVTGGRYRLPTEAEWEYAASGGTEAIYWWGEKPRLDLAHCFDCRSGSGVSVPLPVASFSPNQFNLYDTAGNVSEWVQDCWSNNYRDASSDGSARITPGCQYRVVRGGAFSSPIHSLRTQKRNKYSAAKGYDWIGFRVVRDL